MADTQDLKSCDQKWSCGFDSRPGHAISIWDWPILARKPFILGQTVSTDDGLAFHTKPVGKPAAPFGKHERAVGYLLHPGTQDGLGLAPPPQNWVCHFYLDNTRCLSALPEPIGQINLSIMRILLSASEISTLIANLAQQILSDPDIAATTPERLAIVGIRRRGELIAQRLSTIITGQLRHPVALGALDITMYRDDVVGKRPITIPIGTQMNFRLDDRVVILVDDVLFTGRSVRAALDALVDFGRPRLIRLAVLIERAGREYPVAANFVGRRVNIPSQNIVQVRLRPTDADDTVYIDEIAAAVPAPAAAPPASGVAP